MTKIIFINILFCVSFFVNGQSYVSYTKNISPIIVNKCLGCHNTLGVRLSTYQDILNKKEIIRYVLQKGLMPKWKADSSYSHFSNERFLTPTEFDLINQWLNNGCKEGEKTKIEKITKTNLTQKNTIFLEAKKRVKILESVHDSVIFIYQSFSSKKNEFITGFEFMPGISNTIHHANCFIHKKHEGADAFQSSEIQAYEDGKLTTKQICIEDIVFGCPWVPGCSSLNFPASSGFQLPMEGYVVYELHISPNALPTSVLPSLKLTTSQSRPAKKVLHYVIGTNNHGNYSQSLDLEPNTVKTIIISDTLPDNVNVFAIGPHMHYIGEKIEAFVVNLQNDTIPLIKISDWDFNWQEYYLPTAMLHLQKGSVLYVKSYFDNTTNNPQNPFNPPQRIIEGKKTTNEMINLDLLLILDTPFEED